MFLTFASQFPNHRVCVIIEDLLWRINVSGKKVLEESESLRCYLPKDISKVTHIFQDSTGNLFVTYDENKFYSASFSTLNIQQDIELHLPRDS